MDDAIYILDYYSINHDIYGCLIFLKHTVRCVWSSHWEKDGGKPYQEWLSIWLR